MVGLLDIYVGWVLFNGCYAWCVSCDNGWTVER